MNEIRKNNEAEVNLVEAKFKAPAFLYIIYSSLLFLCMLDVVLGIVLDEVFTISFGITFMLVVITFFVLHIVSIHKSSCTVTNKRIKGVIAVFVFKKTFSYRLDEIDNVEIGSVAGMHTLNLTFAQGNGPSAPVTYGQGGMLANGTNTFKVSFVHNYQEVYDKLSELLCSVKNAKDLQVDIEMNKIEAENRKAAAFEKMASNMVATTQQTATDSDYINQLKGLKELLDAGIISQEEFETKKKELLK